MSKCISPTHDDSSSQLKWVDNIGQAVQEDSVHARRRAGLWDRREWYSDVDFVCRVITASEMDSDSTGHGSEICGIKEAIHIT